MLREIPQVLRLMMLMGEQKSRQKKGGLLLILWTDASWSAPLINCTVAAAGPWCARIERKALLNVLTELNERLFSIFWSCPDPDPEQLRAFTHQYGSLRLLLSFQIKDMRLCFPEWRAHMLAFLRSFALVNAEINIHLALKFDQHTAHYELRAKVKSKLTLSSLSHPLRLDVTCTTQPPVAVKEGYWCHGGHPVCGGRLHLSIPPRAMDEGLFGELSIQFVTLLSPCVLQYPNLSTNISSIQLIVYNPSGIPVLKAPGFFQTLPSSLDFQDVGVDELHCSSIKDVQLCGVTTYAAQQQMCCHPEQESSATSQRLLVFLFLQHSDPFTSLLSDVMVSEVLIERHLEDILNNNQHAVTAALQSELKNTLKAHNRRKKIKEQLRSSAEVILSSSISIVSCSSNLGFRQTCLNRMKVRDTHELSGAFGQSLRRVTSWKYVPRPSCQFAQNEGLSENDEPIRAEM